MPAISPIKRIPLYFCTVLIPISCFAEGTKITHFSPVTITATRTEQTTNEVSTTVSVINETDITHKLMNNIHQLVRYEPGVSVGGSQSRFGYSGFTIRGIGGNRVLTQVDGVGVASDFSFGPFLSSQRDFVDLDTLKQVEIIKGPASSLYGSDAIGGVVSFITKDAADYLTNGNDTFFRLKTGYDGADYSWQRSGTFAGRYQQFDLLLQAGKSTGHNPLSDGQHGGIGKERSRTNPQDKSRESFLSKFGWDISEQQRLQLTYEKFNSDIDSNILTNRKSAKDIQQAIANSGPRGINMTTSQQAKDNSRRERISLLHKLNLNSALADHIETQLSYQESMTKQKTIEDYLSLRPTAPSTDIWSKRYKDARYQERVWHLNSMFQKRFELAATEHLLTYGLDYKQTKNKDIRNGFSISKATGKVTTDKPESDFPDPTTTQYAIFVQDQIQYGHWTFIPGLRYDHYKMAPKVSQRYKNTNAQDHNPSNYSDSKISPKLGITYQINDNYSTYAQYAHGFRAPQAVEIFGEFENHIRRYRALANTNLKAETNHSYELGFRGQFDQGSFGIAAFYNQYKNFIDQEMRPATKPGLLFEFQNINRDDVIIKGIEARGDYDLAHLGLPQGWTIFGTLGYAHGQDKGTHQPINSVEPLKSVFTLGYIDPEQKFGSDLSWTLVARKNRINKEELANPISRSGYGLVDLTGWWQLTDNLSVNAGIYNLTDKRYWNWNDVREATGNTPTQASQLNKAFYSQIGRYGAISFIVEI